MSTIRHTLQGKLDDLCPVPVPSGSAIKTATRDHGARSYRPGSAEDDATPIEYASGNPLQILDPRTRALVILLCLAMEPPARAGRLLLGPPARDARARALRALRGAQRALSPAPLPSALPNPKALRRMLPDLTVRSAFVLKASGLFEHQDTIADLLGIHRATFYRNVTIATDTLSGYLRQRMSG